MRKKSYKKHFLNLIVYFLKFIRFVWFLPFIAIATPIVFIFFVLDYCYDSKLSLEFTRLILACSKLYCVVFDVYKIKNTIKRIFKIR